MLENVNTQNYLRSLIKNNNLTQVEDLMLQNIQLHKMPDVLDALCVQSKKCILSSDIHAYVMSENVNTARTTLVP